MIKHLFQNNLERKGIVAAHSRLTQAKTRLAVTAGSHDLESRAHKVEKTSYKVSFNQPHGTGPQPLGKMELAWVGGEEARLLWRAEVGPG